MQESSQPVVELNNGVKMPQVGLGTFKITSEAEKKSLRDAIMEVGYRHLDTATMYENEAVIGQVLQQCFAEGLKREDIFVTTKLLSCDYADPLAAVNRSLELLQLEYVDLYLVHFPIPFYDEKTKEFQKLPMHKLWASMGWSSSTRRARRGPSAFPTSTCSSRSTCWATRKWCRPSTRSSCTPTCRRWTR